MVRNLKILFRVNREEKGIIEDKAEAAGKKVAVFIRGRLLNDEILDREAIGKLKEILKILVK